MAERQQEEVRRGMFGGKGMPPMRMAMKEGGIASMQGGGRGMFCGKQTIATATTTQLIKISWGGLALIGHSGSGVQGYDLVNFGYGGMGAAVINGGQWAGSLSRTYSMSTYWLRVNHTLGSDAEFWWVVFGL